MLKVQNKSADLLNLLFLSFLFSHRANLALVDRHAPQNFLIKGSIFIKTVCSIRTSLKVTDILEFSRFKTSYGDYHKKYFPVFYSFFVNVQE